MDGDFGNLLAFALFFLMLIIIAVFIFIAHLNENSGKSRRDQLYSEANVVQDDYERIMRGATRSLTEQKSETGFTGIVICQECGRAIPSSNATCGSCRAQVNQE